MATHPGAFDHGADGVGWKSHATHEALPGVHDLALLERVWKTRGSVLRGHPTLSVSYAEEVVREPGVIERDKVRTRPIICECPCRISPASTLPSSPRAAARYALGVTPMERRNAVVKWLGVRKTTAWAHVATDK